MNLDGMNQKMPSNIAQFVRKSKNMNGGSHERGRVKGDFQRFAAKSRLTYEPVGVTLYRQEEALPAGIPFSPENLKSYCQALVDLPGVHAHIQAMAKPIAILFAAQGGIRPFLVFGFWFSEIYMGNSLLFHRVSPGARLTLDRNLELFGAEF
jgi:hypothetical protein